MTDHEQNRSIPHDPPIGTPDPGDEQNRVNPSPESPTPTEQPETSAPAPETAEPAPETAAPIHETEKNVPETVAPAPDEKIIYRWSYADPQMNPPASSHRRKIPVYAFVMSAIFLVSFALLIAVLWVGRYDADLSIKPGIPGIHDDVAIDGVEQAKQIVTVIEVVTPTSTGSGSGIIVRRDGYIATNHHVIEGATSIKVTFYDGTTATAHLIGSSEIDDLAVIKVDRGDLPEAKFAAYADCYVGQTVYAIGAPAGPEFGWTTTRGIISYKDREVKIYDDDNRTLLKKLRLVQTDANVNPGNSGGPLINTSGEVIGVVSMKLAEGYEGIGFAIPADGAVDILNAIIDGKDFDSSVSHKRPMLGITCFDVEKDKYYVIADNTRYEIDESELEQYRNQEIVHPTATGVLVMSVSDGMDAKGKLKKGDIITAVDDVITETGDELTAYINNLYVGDTVVLTVEREGHTLEIRLVLQAQANVS